MCAVQANVRGNLVALVLTGALVSGWKRGERGKRTGSSDVDAGTDSGNLGPPAQASEFLGVLNYLTKPVIDVWGQCLLRLFIDPCYTRDLCQHLDRSGRDALI